MAGTYTYYFINTSAVQKLNYIDSACVKINFTVYIWIVKIKARYVVATVCVRLNEEAEVCQLQYINSISGEIVSKYSMIVQSGYFNAW